MTASVIIPLESAENEPYRPDGSWIRYTRCYPSLALTAELTRIAGVGCHGLWWTEQEAIRNLSRYNWTWCPCGSYEPHGHLMNKLISIKI